MSAVAWSVIAIVTFWCWVTSSLLFVFKAFPRIGAFESRPAKVWGGLSVLCASLWMIALRLS